MAKEDVVVYCKYCGLEIRGAKRCPRCDGEEFGTLKIELPTLFKSEKVGPYIEDLLRRANGYIKSKIPCFLHGGAHYMIWPGVRDENDYSKVVSLFTLPRCPAEVWRHARETGFSNAKDLEEFLGGLQRVG